MATTTLDGSYGIRVNKKSKTKFMKHCKKTLSRPHQEVVREMMTALVEGRLKITPTDDQKASQETLYE